MRKGDYTMKKVKLLSSALALIMLLGILAGCGNGAKTDSDTKAEDIVTEMPAKLTAEKIGSFTKTNITPADGGIIYKDDSGKYGILTLDGKKDTGAKYTYCNALGNNFMVATADPESIKEIADQNCFGIVNAEGKELVPMKYGSLKKLGDRFVRAYIITEETTNEDEALVYATDRLFSLSAQEGDTLYKGSWEIYDTETGTAVPNATGTQAYNTTERGATVEYVTDAKEKVIVNYKGEALPADASVFTNGYYRIDGETSGSVYDAEGNKVFDFNNDGFVPKSGDGDYIIARKTADSGDKYVIMDTTGKIVSAEFDKDTYTIYGDLVQLTDNKVLDFDGKTIGSGTYSHVYIDKLFRQTWLLRNDDDYTMVKKDGTVLYSGKETDDISVDTSSFNIRKKTGDTTKYFCFKTNDFTIEGTSIAPWIIKVNSADNLYDLVDTLSGEAVISGYETYKNIPVLGSLMYIYAEKDGTVDIYTVK